MDKRIYCYKSDCEIVQTGFHIQQFLVCRTCKREVAESLAATIKEKNEKKPEKEINSAYYEGYSYMEPME